MISGLFFALNNTILFGLLYVATLLAELDYIRATYAVLLYFACLHDWIGSLCVAVVLSAGQGKMRLTDENKSMPISIWKKIIAACTVTIVLTSAINNKLAIWKTLSELAQQLQSLSSPTLEVPHTWIEAVDKLCATWLSLAYSLWNAMLGASTPRARSYEPAMGIRWYLDAQMIPEYQSYFDALFMIQPVISACLLRQHIAKDNPTIAAHLAIAIVVLFRRNLVIADVICGAMLLLQHEQVVKRMRHGPLIAAGIAVPLIISPLMFMLWVDRGTGNANYCFFQGLCLWLFCALGISEFCVALMGK